jgi:hypothetical protein
MDGVLQAHERKDRRVKIYERWDSLGCCTDHHGAHDIS